MKHCLLTILLFLFTGAMVNLAVAWGMSLWGDLNPVATTHSGLVGTDFGEWKLSKISRLGITTFISTRRNRSWALAEGLYMPPDAYGPSPGRMVPYWSDLGSPSPQFADQVRQGGYSDERRTVIASGLPFRCLWYEPVATVRSNRVLPTQGGYVRIRQGDGSFPRGLPVRPIWPNLAVNTLFYAVLLWLPICGPFALRHQIRKRRGRCPKCGYPAGASEACSECGARLQKTR